MTGPAQIVVFANRLPIARTLGGWRPASGGLVTALRPVLEASRGAWVGWSGSKGNLRLTSAASPSTSGQSR